MTETTHDTGYAPDRWEFDEEVTRVFDDMLARSIPQYETMREAIAVCAREFMFRHPGGAVLDLGCSRGETIANLAGRSRTSNTPFVGVEISRPMFEAAVARFADDQRVTILERDLRHGLAGLYHTSGRSDRPQPMGTESVAVVLSILTLQFVPINYRQAIVSEAYRLLADGQAMIVVEKILGDGADLDHLFVNAYHDKKKRSGYTEEEVERKRLALEGVLVPLTADWNEALLRRAGFREIDCFWRWMNFAGWVAVK